MAKKEKTPCGHVMIIGHPVFTKKCYYCSADLRGLPQESLAEVYTVDMLPVPGNISLSLDALREGTKE